MLNFGFDLIVFFGWLSMDYSSHKSKIKSRKFKIPASDQKQAPSFHAKRKGGKDRKPVTLYFIISG